MRRVLIYGSIVLVIVLGYVGYTLYQRGVLSGKARAELALQEPEKKESRERLEALYKAWKAFRADHKGAEPGSVEALIPKYLSNPEMLISPTAARWHKAEPGMAPGSIKIGDTSHPVSYGFRWLTAGYSRIATKQGDKAVLIVDDSAITALYHAAYKVSPPPGAFDASKRDQWIPEVQNAKVLVLRRSGAVEEVSPADE